MKITGILSIKNASGLHYPYTCVIKNMCSICENVLVGVDPSYPEDVKALVGLQKQLSNLETIFSPWDDTNNKGGTEIAIQMDKLVEEADSRGADWVVVMQADELVHPDEFTVLRSKLEKADLTVIGYSAERLYFWNDLNTVRDDWGARLVRVFRPYAYSFLADNTDKSGMFSGKRIEGTEVGLTDFYIYHYSRVDDPLAISRRVRNLDTYFHPEDSLVTVDELAPYDFKTRKFDNYSKLESPPEVQGKFSEFTGRHPPEILEWYKGSASR